MRKEERRKGDHTPTRSIRMGKRWDDLEAVYGRGTRSALFEQVASYLLREQGAKLPDRPGRDIIQGLIAAADAVRDAKQ